MLNINPTHLQKSVVLFRVRTEARTTGSFHEKRDRITKIVFLEPKG